jgi:hypothetical protein
MIDVLGKVLDGPWTFSTYETSHDGALLPRVVFLPGWPSFEFREVDRERVNLADPSLPGDDYAKAASLLVSRYLAHGTAGVARDLANARVDSSQGPATRVRRVLTHISRVGRRNRPRAR